MSRRKPGDGDGTREPAKLGLALSFPVAPKTPEQNQFSQERPISVSRNYSLDSFTNSSTPPCRPAARRSAGSSPHADLDDYSRNDGVSGETDTGVNENVLVKKRLVEQFYRMDGKSKQRLLDTLGASFGALLADAKKFQSFQESVGRDISLQAREPPGLISEKLGGMGLDVDIDAFDDGLLSARDCADVLLNLDSQTAGLELERLTSMLHEASAALEREPHFTSPLPSWQGQLSRVEAHLRKVQVLVDVILAELNNRFFAAKAQYHEQTQRSMAKVTRLSELLKSLTERVDSAKANMAKNRDLLEKEIARKIAVLEHVSTRFEEHDQIVRKRRGWQIVVALSLTTLVLSLHMTLNGFQWWSRSGHSK